jgi:hypothetical protein
MPPTFLIKLVKESAAADQIQLSDLIAPEHLPLVEAQGEAPTGCRSAPVLEQMSDELHLHYEDYCSKEKMDFLFTF